MNVKVLSEYGYDEAMLGLSLSYNVGELSRMPAIAKKLAPRDGGHNKFLESMVVYLDVTATRAFWQEFDTYRVGVTKQSESTMHTLMRCKEFTNLVEKFHPSTPRLSIRHLWDAIQEEDLVKAKLALPEGFLQSRVVCTNYKSLKHIMAQRHNHKWPEWPEFVREVCRQLRHAGFLC